MMLVNDFVSIIFLSLCLDYFYKLIQNSQRDLDQLFQITYKERYRNNTMVFKKLYISLRQFMNGSEWNLKTQVDEFFARLFQIVYTMSNPMYKFDDNYQTCIHDSTPTAMPFADAQPKITVQILRSFIASKVFLEGLRTAYDVSKKLLSIPRHDACKANFMRMTHCSICQNIDDAKPCKAYCSNVMKGCYVYIIMIQPKWNRLIQDMMELADKLQGPFSMEAIIGPLGVKISEAIMVFQHNKLNVTNKVGQQDVMHILRFSMLSLTTRLLIKVKIRDKRRLILEIIFDS